MPNLIFNRSNHYIRIFARFGQENGANEGETTTQQTIILKKFPKTFKTGFASIHISSNLFAKAYLINKWR